MQAFVDLDKVWVLSLPSLTWYQSTYTPSDARFLHTCHVPGNRRQMVAIGGIIPELEIPLQPPDPWPQGLGIFDLTEMQWKDSYDAKAERYETPKVVKDGIESGGVYPGKWDDPVISEWLTGICMRLNFLSRSPKILLTYQSSISRHKKHRDQPRRWEGRPHRRRCRRWRCCCCRSARRISVLSATEKTTPIQHAQ